MKGWWGRMLCIHDYEILEEWNNAARYSGGSNIPYKRWFWARFRCKKCGNYIIYKLLKPK